MKPELTTEQLAQPIAVTLPLGVLLGLSNDKPAILVPGAPTRLDKLRQKGPAIGEKGLHGIYAGIARGYNDELDGVLEVLDEAPEPMTWEKAKAWVESIGGRLPTRKEQALLFANVPELFKQEAYWSCEPYAGNESYAWCQTFGYGFQGSTRKVNELRARAVRRLPLPIE